MINMVRRYFPRGSVRYPWREWFSKKMFKLQKGIDYHCRTYTMGQQIRNAARRPEFNVSISYEIAQDDSYIIVSVKEKDTYDED